MISQSILITGGSEEQRLEKAKELLIKENINDFDILWINQQESVGIEQIRLLSKSLLLKPHSSPLHAGCIHNAQKLTVESQNAMLKLLEEPPPSSLVILTASTSESLLPTVVSRCHHIRLSSSSERLEIDNETVEKIMTGSFASLMELAAEHEKEREEAVVFIDSLTASLRAQLYSLYIEAGDTKQVAHQYDRLLSLLQETREAVLGYVNPRLALEYLFFTYRSQEHALQK